jgi:cytochrome c553
MRRFIVVAALLSLFVSAPAGAGGDPEAGRKKVEQHACQQCHGADGNQTTAPQFPKLAGQHADYLVKALADYRSGARNNPIMKGIADKLSKQDRLDIGAYYATRQGELRTVEDTR